MTPDEIRNLRGHDLDRAIAAELGVTAFIDATAGGRLNVGGMIEPHASMDAAWSLDGEGWEWLFVEDHNKVGHRTLYASITERDTKTIIVAILVNISAFSTQAEAYATTRCIAWLLAMGTFTHRREQCQC